MFTIKSLVRLCAAVLCVVLLSSCQWLWDRIDTCKPSRVVFPTEVIGGSYSGWLYNYPQEGVDTELRLILEAEYVDAREYSLHGDFILGDSAPLAVTAEVRGHCGSRYHTASADLEPQMTAPPGENLSGEISSGDTVIWVLRHRHGLPHSQLDPDNLEGDLQLLEPVDPGAEEYFNFTATRE